MTQKRRKEAAKRAVLNALKLLSEDRHPRNQTLIARFARCSDYQRATRLLAEAIRLLRKVSRQEAPCHRRLRAINGVGILTSVTPGSALLGSWTTPLRITPVL